MKVNKRERTQKRLVAVLGILLMMSFMLGSAGVQNVFASGLSSGSGEVTVGRDVELQFLNQKTIDLSNSDIDITLTQAEKDALEQEADESALMWVYKTVAIESCDEIQNLDSEEIVAKFNLYEKYWQENVDIESLTLTEEAQARVDKIASYGTATKLLELSDAEAMELVGLDLTDADEETKQFTYKSYRNALEGKIAEIYNDKQSDALVEKIAGAVPVQVNFSIETIKDDEASKYGVDGSNIKAGKLKKNAKSEHISTINFGNKDQFYDEILSDAMVNYFKAGRITEDDSGNDLVNIKDNRGLFDHVVFIDGGSVVSSDYSQKTTGTLRGNTEYPGWHYLLEVGDPLSVYAWGRYSFPGSNYVQTFNLHLNPAVTYMAGDIQEDLITDVTFDKNGKLLTVSKPIFDASEIRNLLGTNTDGEAASTVINTNVEDGTYRFKLVESSVDPKAIGNNIFYGNDEVKLIDVHIKGGRMYLISDESEYAFEVYEDTEAAKSGKDAEGTVFTNYLNKKPQVEKTIEGSSELKLEKLDQPFTYRISTTVPKGVTSFVIEDKLEQVLEFVDEGKTAIKISGNPVSSAANQKMLKQTASELTVSLDADDIENVGGKEIAVEFTCKLKKGTNVNSYKEKKYRMSPR